MQILHQMGIFCLPMDLTKDKYEVVPYEEVFPKDRWVAGPRAMRLGFQENRLNQRSGHGKMALVGRL